MLYRIRFAFHLWWNIRDLSLLDAWRYPCDPTQGDRDPIEDAEAEMSEMYA